MRWRFILLLVLISVGSCKKDDHKVETSATVLSVGDDFVLVEIKNPDPGKHSFLCPQSDIVFPAGSNNCINSVFILNLPGALKTEGKLIRFSKFKDQGPRAIWSFSYAAHDLLVYDATER